MTWAIGHVLWGSFLACMILKGLAIGEISMKKPSNHWSADNPRSIQDMFGQISQSFD
jgi:hypothetical protein